MIVTDHFVYIHTSRTAGTFLNKLIHENVPGARMLRYHGHLSALPEQFAHLPVIGFTRNPWDWYVSMFNDYKRKHQYVFQIISERGRLDFEKTIDRFLRLGDDSVLSKRLRSQLVRRAPVSIDHRTPPRLRNPGLRSENFRNFPSDRGYFSWLFGLMYGTTRTHDIRLGRFENLREDTLRLFEETGVTMNDKLVAAIRDSAPLNGSPRPKDFIGGYTPELEQLVAEKDADYIDQFGYQFVDPSWSAYPKTDFFRSLGTADVSALAKRVLQIPDEKWEQQNDEKPNKINNLNDTRHITFRFVDGFDKVYDSHDRELWGEWKESLLPVMQQAAAELGYSDYRFPRVMLARLPAGGRISGHSDRQASHYIHKIHVPITTNDKTFFRVGSDERHLSVGEIVEVNNKRNHAVRNDGDEDRIHLIFECYNSDDYGKVS